MIKDNCIHMLLCLFGACFGLKAIQPENIHIKFRVCIYNSQSLSKIHYPTINQKSTSETVN